MDQEDSGPRASGAGEWRACPVDEAASSTQPSHAAREATQREQHLARARAWAANQLDGLIATKLAGVPGGAELALITEAIDPAVAGLHVVLESIAACERIASWAAAQQAGFVQEALRRRVGSGASPIPGAVVTADTAAEEALAAEVGARLALTPRSARMVIDRASALDAAPEVHDALSRGELDTRKASILANCPAGLPLPRHGELIERMLPIAPRVSSSSLKRRIDRAVLEIAPEAGVARHEEAHADRCVSLQSAGDGMAWVTAYLRADHALAVRHRLDIAADATSGRCDTGSDARTLDQLRADALVELITQHEMGIDCGTPRGAVPRRRGRRGRREVAVYLSGTASALRGEAGPPAELAGYGAIHPTLAHQIINERAGGAKAADRRDAGAGAGAGSAGGDLVISVTDSGPPPATAAYVPGDALARAVRERDQRCTFPGCSVPASYADLDHIAPYRVWPGTSAGGTGTSPPQTRAENLHVVCRPHHNLKTVGWWSTRREQDGTLRWIGVRTGHSYEHLPEGVTTVAIAGARQPAGTAARSHANRVAGGSDDDEPP